MSVLEQLRTDRRLQLGLLLVVGILVYIFGPGAPSTGAFTSEEINDLLSGSNTESDVEKIPIEHQSLEPPYVDESKGYTNDWKIHGDVIVNKNEYVRLTSDVKDQSGLIFNKNSFDTQGFQIDFSFNIHGHASGNALKGDGMALFLTDKPLREGPVFGAEDRFNGLGLFFDTYRNARKGKVFPFISVMNGDGQTWYDKDNDGKANQLGGCTARHIYNSPNNVVEARLIHTTQDGYLSLDYKLQDEWVNCFSIKDVFIPKKRYLGFGAATGDLSENVDVFDAQVYELQHHGKVVLSFEEFAHDEANEEIEEKQASGYDKKRKWRKERNEKQRSKLRAKMRNKQNRAAKFKDNSGADEAPSFLRTLWWLVKTAFLTLAALLVLYVAFTVYRVKKRSFMIKKKHTGLLD
jgi:mannose-binding lectin 2